MAINENEHYTIYLWQYPQPWTHSGYGLVRQVLQIFAEMQAKPNSRFGAGMQPLSDGLSPPRLVIL